MGACSNNGEPASCSQDYNCLGTEKCYNGKCIPTTEIPTNQDAGITEKTNPDTVVTNPDKTTNPDKSVEPDKVAASYPPPPHGADINDVMIPFKLMACNGTTAHKMADYYKDPNIKVILFTVHTGW